MYRARGRGALPAGRSVPRRLLARRKRTSWRGRVRGEELSGEGIAGRNRGRARVHFPSALTPLRPFRRPLAASTWNAIPDGRRGGRRRVGGRIKCWESKLRGKYGRYKELPGAKGEEIEEKRVDRKSPRERGEIEGEGRGTVYFTT